MPALRRTTGRRICCGATRGDVGISNNWFGWYSRGGGGQDNDPRFTTFFKSYDHVIAGNQFFKSTDPFLTGVIRMNGKFYYCWDILNQTEGGGNWAMNQIMNQQSRYRLWRDIEWTLGFNTKPRDGTGVDWDF